MPGDPQAHLGWALDRAGAGPVAAKYPSRKVSLAISAFQIEKGPWAGPVLINGAEGGNLQTPVRPVLPDTVLSGFSPKVTMFASCSCCPVMGSAEGFVDKWWTELLKPALAVGGLRLAMAWLT